MNAPSGFGGGIRCSFPASRKFVRLEMAAAIRFVQKS